jgi:hypothetical protein
MLLANEKIKLGSFQLKLKAVLSFAIRQQHLSWAYLSRSLLIAAAGVMATGRRCEYEMRAFPVVGAGQSRWCW